MCGPNPTESGVPDVDALRFKFMTELNDTCLSVFIDCNISWEIMATFLFTS